jgi:hypothetical protein
MKWGIRISAHPANLQNDGRRAALLELWAGQRVAFRRKGWRRRRRAVARLPPESPLVGKTVFDLETMAGSGTIGG